MEDEWCRCCPRRTFTQTFKQWKNVWRKLLIAHQRNVLLKRTSHHFCHHRLLSFKFFLCTTTIIIIVNIFTKNLDPNISSCFIFTILQKGNSPKKCHVPSDWKIFWFCFENQTNNRSPKATSQSWVNKAPRKSTVQSSVIITSHCCFFASFFTTNGQRLQRPIYRLSSLSSLST